MALVAPVKNGKLEELSSETTTKAKESNDLGYEQFLQILCAEMQYQDPLEPTSNTEYISQLATFSQLESTLDLNDKSTAAMANNLVGKYVILKPTSSTTGETYYVPGVVDYVMYEKGEVFLSVNNGLYSIDDLDTVADADYMDAVTLAETFHSMMALLPSVSKLTISDASKIESARQFYDALTSYQKAYVNADDLDALKKLEQQLKVLQGTNTTEGADSSEESDSTTENGENNSDAVN